MKGSGADRGLRPRQGGEAGAALRFFKAPPRGCGKIGKRNPSGGALLYKLWLARGWLCRGMSTGRTSVPCGSEDPRSVFRMPPHPSTRLLNSLEKNKNRDAPVVKRCVPFLFSFAHSAVPEPCVPRSGCRANQKLHRARKRKREYGMEESEPLAEGSAALVRFN